MSTKTTTSRKVLIPFATLVAAGAVAIGSGATFSSESDRSVSVTAGTLVHTNGNDGATLTLSNIVPGDTMTGTVVVENTGDVDSTLDLGVSGAVDSTFSDYLTITVTENGVELYDGPFNDLAITGTDLAFPAEDDAATTEVVEDKATYVFTVTLENNTTGTDEEQNVDQGKAADATFTWTQTQVAGGSLDENWVAPTP